jgi:hypothetical protein
VGRGEGEAGGRRGSRPVLLPGQTQWSECTRTPAVRSASPPVAAPDPLCRGPQAKLRREATEAAKRAARLELELKKHERLAGHRAADVASLRAALKGGLGAGLVCSGGRRAAGSGACVLP